MTHEVLSTYKIIHNLNTYTRVFFSLQTKLFRTIDSHGRLELVIQFTQHLYQYHYFNIAIF